MQFFTHIYPSCVPPRFFALFMSGICTPGDLRARKRIGVRLRPSLPWRSTGKAGRGAALAFGRHAVCADAQCLTLSISNFLGPAATRRLARAAGRVLENLHNNTREVRGSGRKDLHHPWLCELTLLMHTSVASEVRRGRKEGRHRFPPNALPTVTKHLHPTEPALLVRPPVFDL